MSGFIGNVAGEGNVRAVKKLFDVGFKSSHIIMLFFFVSSLLVKNLFVDYLCTNEIKELFSQMYELVFIGFALCNTNEKLLNGMILVLNN